MSQVKRAERERERERGLRTVELNMTPSKFRTWLCPVFEWSCVELRRWGSGEMLNVQNTASHPAVSANAD